MFKLFTIFATFAFVFFTTNTNIVYAHDDEYDDSGSSDAVNLFVRLNYYDNPSCSGSIVQTQTRARGVCQPSLDNTRGLLYQCVKAGTTVLQLSDSSLTCQNNNNGNPFSTVTSFSPSQCLFSSSAQRYVRIICDSTSIVTTVTTGGRVLPSHDEEIML